MTVTYTAEVASCHGLGCFWRLLFRWRGSIYKLLWPNLIVYTVLYYALYFLYIFVLEGETKRTFEVVSGYCKTYSDLIPLSFVLGFYVNLVVKRWWEMFQAIPSTDTLALFVSNSIHGQDERCRLMRRTIMRYVNLSYVMILCMISTRVKKRFPTLDHLVDAGIMQPSEKKIFDDLNARSRHTKYWMPLVWAGSIIARARKEGRIRDDFAVKTLLDELCNFRSKCGALNGYDWVPIPLVYTQVVTLAVYSFFVATLMGRQLIGEQQNIYFPVFAFLQFFFYMGWLKVAESLVNPFGEDDDDFETNFLIDRNLQVSYLIVDEMHAEHPELIRDQYWDDVFPEELPHTIASQPFRSSPYMGSTAHLEMTPNQAEMFSTTPQLHRLEEESEDDLTDEELLPDDGGESGIKIQGSVPRKIKRQISLSDQSEPPNSLPGSSHIRVSRKPSVLSVFQRVFQKDGAMGSNMSLRSNSRKNTFVRSNSRVSTGGTSRPQTPNNQTAEDIFKMSDLSLNSGSTTNMAKKPPTGKVPPLNLNKTESKARYGKNLHVDREANAGSGQSSENDDEELLISNNQGTAKHASIQPPHSPSLRKQQMLVNNKTSPKLGRKLIPSPQPSPKSKVPPTSFYVSSDGSQTDGGTDKDKTEKGPLTADVELFIEDSNVVDGRDEAPVSRTRPVNLPPRIHKESLREVGELEPIDEQLERSDLSPKDV